MKFTIRQKIQTATGYELTIQALGHYSNIYMPVSKDDFDRFSVGENFELMLIPMEAEVA